MTSLRLVFAGLSLSSSWGNGHATTYRALLRALSDRGHDILFLERDVPWYKAHRDLSDPDFCRLAFYEDVEDFDRFQSDIANADAVIVGSYVPDGVAIGSKVQGWAKGATAFYDIDTPVTLAKLARGDFEYLSPEQVSAYDVYFSFTGGRILQRLLQTYGSPAARALYCSVDPELYPSLERDKRWHLSYLGTYSPDRQPALERLLIEPARRAPHLRFAVAGPQYPKNIVWPSNVERTDHVPPGDHPEFYAQSLYTLNVTRADMIAAGYSPSVRLFEAAACGTPIISDIWDGLDSLFVPGREIALASSPQDVLDVIEGWPMNRRESVAQAARRHVLAEHTAAHRAQTLETSLREVRPRAGAGRSLEIAAE